MVPGAKLFLGFATTAIFGSGVGIPLSFSVGRNTSASQGGAADPKVKVDKCNSSEMGNWASVNFGEPNIKEACGSIESSSDTSSATSEPSQLSNLFSEMGLHRDGSGSSKSSNKWRSMCATGGSNQFVLPNASGGQANGKEYIGLCDSSASSSQGISIENQNQEQEKDSLIIKACTGDGCGQLGESGDQSDNSTNIKNFQSESGNGGHQVTFKKKN